ncbi:MAG: hypothetical protein ACE5KG_06250, partial [Nitrososphaerales archaeon]
MSVKNNWTIPPPIQTIITDDLLFYFSQFRERKFNLRTVHPPLLGSQLEVLNGPKRIPFTEARTDLVIGLGVVTGIIVTIPR